MPWRLTGRICVSVPFPYSPERMESLIRPVDWASYSTHVTFYTLPGERQPPNVLLGQYLKPSKLNYWSVNSLLEGHVISLSINCHMKSTFTQQRNSQGRSARKVYRNLCLVHTGSLVTDQVTGLPSW